MLAHTRHIAPALVILFACAVAMPLAASAVVAQDGPQTATPPGGAAGGAKPEAPFELVDPKVLRVCADPHNMPYSNTELEGFENKLADLIAKQLGKGISYTWYPNAPGFVRQTLALYKCDIIMGMPQGDDIVQVTNPYYRTAYALVYKAGNGLDGVDTLTDPRLKDKHIGIVAGTPPATNMVLDGLMANAKPYPLVVDTRFDSSAVAMVKDIADGNIDAGVLWGPLAGYHAKHAGAPVTIVPLLKETNGPRLSYRIGMGVRYSDQDWKRDLNRLIREQQPVIDALLQSYGVPLVDESNNLVSPAAATK
ncbi:MAG TPA: substrate-binding domain-containing protein [Pseudolabrys sp.]|nr:substrate-binding domain-containing protein [Pseudolabrys sp.]